MSSTAPQRRLPTATPNGLLASVLLAFLATAGLFYVNIMAALVDGLITGLGLSEKQAGFVGSANIYGAAFGALFVVFLVQRLPWRPMAYALLIGLIVIDFISTLITQAEVLIAIRAAHGFIGGMLVGVGFAVIARTAIPDRTFGMLLVVQFGVGGLGVMLLPQLVPVYGPQVLFLALALFSIAALLMVPFLDNYPPVEKSKEQTAQIGVTHDQLLFLGLTLGAIFLFQGANMALAAYIIGLGRDYGLEVGFISITIGVAAWIGALGSALVIVLNTKYGRAWPIALGMIFTLVGCAAFLRSDLAWLYFIANCGTAITWAFVIPYLLGMSAAFDSHGQAAALGGFASKMGLASGPLFAAFLLDGGSYAQLILIAVGLLVIAGLVALVPARKLDLGTAAG